MSKNKISSMKFGKIYPLLVQKAERKGRTKQEVDEIICWLTGYTPDTLHAQIEKDVDYKTLFDQAPCINPNCVQITGKICGIAVECIEDPVERYARYLDKLVDELARGKAMERILHRKTSDSSKKEENTCDRA